MALLTDKQRIFINRISQLVIHDSSEFTNGSGDNGPNNSHDKVFQKAFNESIRKMVRSNDSLDSRLINLYHINQMLRKKIRIHNNEGLVQHDITADQKDISFVDDSVIDYSSEK